MVACSPISRGFADNFYDNSTDTSDVLIYNILYDRTGAISTGGFYTPAPKRKKRCKRKQPRKKQLPEETNQEPGDQPKYKFIPKSIGIISGIKKTKIAKTKKIDVYNRKIFN